MLRIKDYADLFAPDGRWRKKRAEKKIFFTEKSLRTRAAVMKNYVVALWGDTDPRRLTVRMIDLAMEGIASKLTGRPLAGATRNRILSVLSELYVYLIGENRVKTNPVRDVIRCRSRPEHPRGAVSIAAMKRLFPRDHDGMRKLYVSQKYICAFLVLRDTGLRPGELVALRWRDWYPDLRFFPVMRAIESGTRDHEKGTKTGAAKPAMLTVQAAEEMERLRKKTKPRPEHFIFANYKNVPFDPHRLTWAFHRAVRLAGLEREDLTPYWLRHTFNTRSLETLPDEVVRRLMGHGTEAMTRHYRDADVDSLIREAGKIRETVDASRLY
ncbi:MAG: site-specific integrase [Treponema sp.]|jgi:integrase|nr:site-specific integrase [Treponema sp.]